MLAVRTLANTLVTACLLSATALAAQDKPAPLTVAVPVYPNSSCPIMGKPASTRLFVDIEFGRIYVCCKSCNRKIQRDPVNAHKTAYPVVKKHGNQTCPVSDKAVGESKATVLLQGQEIALCSDTCKPTAQQTAQVVLAKVNDPEVVDVGNAACPISGEAATPAAVVLIGKQLVRLASLQQVKAVEKDPAKALAVALDKTRKPVASSTPTKPPVAEEDDEEMDETGKPKAKSGKSGDGKKQ
jgi:hypothetical protein